MADVLIINGHQPFPDPKGGLNPALPDQASTHLIANADPVRQTDGSGGYDGQAEATHSEGANIAADFQRVGAHLAAGFPKVEDQNDAAA